MSKSLLTSPVWSFTQALPGPETQILRHLIRRSRRCLAAINEGSPSLLRMILPLGMESLSVRHGLLSLSKRGSERSEVDLYHYQMAISQLCTDINGIEPDKLDIQQVHRLLAASLLLYVASLPYSDGSWAQHIRGMISVVRLTDQSILASTELGRFLLCMSSVPDIPTFSVGRDYSSQKAWVSWMLHRTSTGDGGELTCLETMLGYPESLLNIIARVAELGDDRYMQEALKEPRLGQSRDSCDQGLNDLSNGLEDELELSLRQWEMPMLLKGMSPMQKLALRTSWETFRKASLLYLWRRHGFRANILQPIRHDRQIQAKALVQDILVNVGAILEMGKDKRISIGNAMLWPLAVVGCEYVPITRTDDNEVIALLDAIAQIYQLEHVRHIKEVFRYLWRRILILQSHEGNDGITASYVSLESVARELQITASLL